MLKRFLFRRTDLRRSSVHSCLNRGTCHRKNLVDLVEARRVNGHLALIFFVLRERDDAWAYRLAAELLRAYMDILSEQAVLARLYAQEAADHRRRAPLSRFGDPFARDIQPPL